MRVAVVLSGCGYLDGAEIRESVLSLLYLDEQGAKVQCFAPDTPQADVVNHLTGEPKEEFRGVLEESARIARGEVKPLTELKADDFDALLLPGGFGVAKNLSDFVANGAKCTVNIELDQTIHAFFDAKKPIGAICIAPVVLAASLKGMGIKLTVGDNADVAAAIEALGNHHIVIPSDAACIDEENQIISCSAYMREDALAPIAAGIQACVSALISFIKKQPISKAS